MRLSKASRIFGSTRRGSSADILVVGLGNPDAEFEDTRHNLGAETVELLGKRHGQGQRHGHREVLRAEKGTRSRTARVEMGGHSVALAVPQTYMNESGIAVASLARRYGIESPEQIVVVHDELDLPSARVKVKRGGGSAGHNGLESLNSHLHDRSYLRVRIGIGKPPGRMSGADFVLRRPGRAEREQLDLAVGVAADAVEAIVSSGVDAAMQLFNGENVS